MPVNINALVLFVHLFCAVVWVGGMFFAHFALRPAATVLEPEPRLRLMTAALGNFFRIVAAAVSLTLRVSAFCRISRSSKYLRDGVLG